MTLPADIVNRSLDAIGRSDLALGDLEEGTEGAKPALRAYVPAVRQLLRAAHWDFARKQITLNLLADATGQTAGVGTTVITPWLYEYEFPVDCEKVRFVPWNYLATPPFPPGNIATPPNVPIVGGLGAPLTSNLRLRPSPFLVSTDANYPVQVGVPATWGAEPQWWLTDGTGPAQRTVILSNTKQAQCVYTAFIPYPSQWDALFEEALVQLLALRLSMPLSKDPKLGMAIRAQAIPIVKDAVSTARATNGNEAAFPTTTDHTPDWMRARDRGSIWGAWGWGPGGGIWEGGGGLWGGWDGLSLGDGSVF